MPARLHSAHGRGSEVPKGAAGRESPAFPSLLGDLIDADGQPGTRPEAKPSKKAARKPLPQPSQAEAGRKPEEEPARLAPVALFSGSATEPTQPPVPAEDEKGLAFAPQLTAAGHADAPLETIAGALTSQPSVQPAIGGASEVVVAAEEAPADWGTLLDPAVALARSTQANGAEPAGNEASALEETRTDWTELLYQALAQAPGAAQPAPIQTGGSQSPEGCALDVMEPPELPAQDPGRMVRLSGAGVPVAAAPLPLPEEHRTPEMVEALSATQHLGTAGIQDATAPDPATRATAPQPELTNSAKTMDLAFAAHLVPMTGSGDPVAGTAVPQTGPPTGNPAGANAPAGFAGKPAPPAVVQTADPATDHQSDHPPAWGQEPEDSAAERVRKAGEPQAAGAGGPAAVGKFVAGMPVAPQPQAEGVSAQPAGPVRSNALLPKVPLEPVFGPEPRQAPAAAREIRLEVNGGDQRVEVRLVERGGEVHVAVRTPDAHLSESLREDLPALSSRLAESGFRTETWRPGAAGGGEWHRQAELSASGSPQEPNGHPRQNGREQQPEEQSPPQPKAPEEQVNRKEKGKDFEWFMSTLR
jgi:hypothetical protein